MSEADLKAVAEHHENIRLCRELQAEAKENLRKITHMRDCVARLVKVLAEAKEYERLRDELKTLLPREVWLKQVVSTVGGVDAVVARVKRDGLEPTVAALWKEHYDW